ncbi:MAG: cation:proton antiporter [Flavobacteriales bacterium]
MSVAQRSILFYVLTIALFGGLIYWTITQGDRLRPNLAEDLAFAAHGKPVGTALEQFQHTVGGNMHHAFGVLLMQIVAIIAVARLFAYLFNKLGQPTVIGEIVAGIVLGPSVVGYWFPGVFHFLFPEGSLDNLQFMSQIGLLLFMFVVGLELDLKLLSGRAHDSVVISHASIIIPYAMGVGLAYWLYVDFAPPTVSFLSFALFMGIAMSITAFPVLARVLQERGLSRTRLGTLALTCAAADDVTAWCILAAVIAIVKAGSAVSALYTITAALLYVLVMVGVLRPFLRRVGDIYTDRESISKPVVALVFLVMLGSAYTTESIGIHALFGAFLAGAIMPPSLSFHKVLINKLEDVSLVLLLPLFFVFTGLRTRIGLLNDEHLWWICGAVVGVAVLGKFGGSAIAARFTGNSWRDSLSIGALMNTRGLMELVVLNIGYDLGVLNPEIFVMLVLMALITTFMTGPALTVINRWFREKATTVVRGEPVVLPGWRVLISFGQPQSGRQLLRLAHQLTSKEQERTAITAMHLTPSMDVNPIDSGDFEHDSFKPIKREAEHLGRPIETVYKVSGDVSREIVQMANSGGYDLLLVGSGKPLLKGTFLGDLLGFTTRVIDPSKLLGTLTGRESLLPADDQLDPRLKQFIEGTQCSVGILMDKQFDRAREVLLPVFAPGDSFLFHYAERLMHNVEARVTLLDVAGLTQRDANFRMETHRLQELAPGRLTVMEQRAVDKPFLDRFDFLLISYASWSRLAESRSLWLAHVPSTLLIKP